MEPPAPIKTDEEKEDWDHVKGQDWVNPIVGDGFEESDTRLRYELQETRAFFRRKLKEINPETFQVSLQMKMCRHRYVRITYVDYFHSILLAFGNCSNAYA